MHCRSVPPQAVYRRAALLRSLWMRSVAPPLPRRDRACPIPCGVMCGASRDGWRFLEGLRSSQKIMCWRRNGLRSSQKIMCWRHNGLWSSQTIMCWRHNGLWTSQTIMCWRHNGLRSSQTFPERCRCIEGRWRGWPCGYANAMAVALNDEAGGDDSSFQGTASITLCRALCPWPLSSSAKTGFQCENLSYTVGFTDPTR